jgi:cyclopropane fatty-acyl-phospholipid synthase-like methyltransferase
MLDNFRRRLAAEGISGVELVQCDVLRLDDLPSVWNSYDLLVSASMLEYVPRDRFVAALNGLRGLLRWWDSHLYSADELTRALAEAGFKDAKFGAFPFWFRHLTPWGHIVEAVP